MTVVELQAEVASLRALLVDAREVLGDHRYTTVLEGDYYEDYNNEDVIALLDRIEAALA